MKSNPSERYRTVFTFLIMMAIMAVSATSIQAQTSEVQELKNQVKQLKDLVDQLTQKIATVEEAQKQSTPAVTYVPEPAAAAATTADDEEKEKSSLEIYGFAMLDTGYDFRTNHPDWYDVVRPTKLPSFGGEFAPNGKYYMGVRQSRLGVKTSTPTKYGDLKTVFEFELFGTGVDAGQTTFRIRHAYGELGQVGAGQYWTVFGDTDAYPNTFEYWGPNGLVWFRNVQLRWMPLKGRNSITIALEKPGAGADLGDYADRIELAGVRPKLAWPDLTGHVRFDRDWGHIQVSGLLRSIRWVDTNNDAFDLGGSAVGFGGSFSSHFNFGENNIGRFQFTYGKGIENYMNDAPVDIGVKNNLGDPLRPIVGVALPVFGMSTFLDHTWSERFTSSFGYSMLNIENSDGQAGNAFRRGQYGIGNLLYYPVKNVTIGGEFQWGRRANFFDGYSVDDYRLQFSFRYNFSKVLKF